MNLKYDPGSGWYDADTGRSYSWQEVQSAQPSVNSLIGALGVSNPFNYGVTGREPGRTLTSGLPGLRDGNRMFDDAYLNAQGGSIGAGGPSAAYGNQAGAPAGTQAPAMTAQDRVNARAQALADARLRNQTERPTTAADLFGVGGGDWASAWLAAQQPRQTPFDIQVGRQLAGPNVSSGLAGLFNSASGPYGQMQAAAAYTAPARNDRQARMYEADAAKEIANMKYSTANRVLGNLANLMSSPAQMNGFETDYGASARLQPTNIRRYF